VCLVSFTQEGLEKLGATTKRANAVEETASWGRGRPPIDVPSSPLGEQEPLTVRDPMKPAALLSGLFLCFVAIAHLARVLLGVEITANSIILPMWPSVVAVVVLPALAIWLWREQSQPR